MLINLGIFSNKKYGNLYMAYENLTYNDYKKRTDFGSSFFIYIYLRLLASFFALVFP